VQQNRAAEDNGSGFDESRGRKWRIIELQGLATVFQIYVWHYAPFDSMLHILLETFRYESQPKCAFCSLKIIYWVA